MMEQETKKSLSSLKLLIKRLQHHLQLQRRKLDMLTGFERKGAEANDETVPDDVMEGCFAIVAKDEDDKPTRFVVRLCVLKHPGFLRLLEMAEEEYGLRQRGALAVPCRPDELKMILQDKTWKSSGGGDVRNYSLVC